MSSLRLFGFLAAGARADRWATDTVSPKSMHNIVSSLQALVLACVPVNDLVQFLFWFLNAAGAYLRRAFYSISNLLSTSFWETPSCGEVAVTSLERCKQETSKSPSFGYCTGELMSG